MSLHTTTLLPRLHAIIDESYTKDQLAKKAGKARCREAKCKSDYVWAMLLFLGDTTDDKRINGLLVSAKERVRAEAAELETLGRLVEGTPEDATWADLRKEDERAAYEAHRDGYGREGPADLTGLVEVLEETHTVAQLKDKAGKARVLGAKTKRDHAWGALLFIGQDTTRVDGLLVAAKDRVAEQKSELGLLRALVADLPADATWRELAEAAGAAPTPVTPAKATAPADGSTARAAADKPRDALGRFTSPKAVAPVTPAKATAPADGSTARVKTAATDQPRDAKGRFTKKAPPKDTVTAAPRSLNSDFDKAATSDDGSGMVLLLGLGAAAAMYVALS